MFAITFVLAANPGTVCDKCGSKYFNYFKRFMTTTESREMQDMPL